MFNNGIDYIIYNTYIYMYYNNGINYYYFSIY